MQLVDQTDASGPPIRAVSADSIRIGEREWRQNILVQPGTRVAPWIDLDLESLGVSDADELLSRSPEVVILGTGTFQAFAPAVFAARLLAAGVGLECMTNAAAARTFNLLAGEGRNVLGAFLFRSGA